MADAVQSFVGCVPGASAFIALLGLTFACLVAAAGPADAIYEANGVKARMIRQFANFAEWPSNVFASPLTPLVMGFLANDADGEVVLGQLREKSASGHRVEVRSCKTVEDAKGCQLLFFSRSAAGKLRLYMAAIEGRTILTVGEGGEFLDNGGMISIVEEKGRLGFDVSLPPVRRAGLGLSANVLSIARTVRRGS